MINRLSVYGTLAPGCPNEHILAPIQGSWVPALVKGRLLNGGWGAQMGYPGMVPDANGDDIAGWVLSADNLAAHWPMLDEFEGAGYQRVVVCAQLDDGTQVDVYVYGLHQSAVEPGN